MTRPVYHTERPPLSICTNEGERLAGKSATDESCQAISWECRICRGSKGRIAVDKQHGVSELE